MSKTKTATVGGTPTSPAATSYTNWMQGQLGGGYNNAINTLLSGSAAGDPKSLTSYFQQMGQQGGANISPINYNSPGFVGTQFNQPALSNQQMPGWNGTQFQQAPMFNTAGALGTMPTWKDPNLNNNIQMNAGGIDPNSDYGKAIQQMVGTQQQQDVAALRERFTGTGSSTGTPAAIAESNLRSQSAPQLIGALEQANQGERGLNLQQMGLANQAVGNMNNLIGTLGQAQNQFNQGNAQFGSQFGLQGAGLNADIVNQMNQLMGQQGLAQNQFNQGNAQMGMQQTGMNADIMNQLNQLMLGQNQNQNQFNLANSGQDLQAQMGNAQNSMQNQQMMNQYGLGMGNLYQGLQGLNLQGMLGALGPMAGQFSQLLGLGTPQAQTIQKPTMWGNILNTAGDITGMGANIAGMMSGGGLGGLGGWLSGLFGGGGNNNMMVNPYGGGQQMMPTQMGNYPSYGGGLFSGFTPNWMMMR